MKRIRWILQSLLLALMLSAAVTGCGGTAGETDGPHSDPVQTQIVQTAGDENEGTEIPEETETDFEEVTEEPGDIPDSMETPEEDGSYTSKDDVALYLHIYGRLPDNYITKKEAQDLGWDNKAGNLWDVAPGRSIGGDRFGNYEGLLPDADGRKYYECDIDYEGGYRGSKRIIFSNDGLIFYTEDHYESFEQLYE